MEVTEFTYEGLFGDGVTAHLRPTRISLSPTGLVLAPEGLPNRHWSLADLRRVAGNTNRDRLGYRLDGADSARLWLSDRQLIDALARAAPKLGQRPKIEGKGRILGFAATAVGSVLLIIFVLVPLLAAQLAKIMPPEGERALGVATLTQVTEMFGGTFCDKPAGRMALRKIYDRIAVGATLPYGVDLHVIESDMVNAFALPGGQIVVMEGLLTTAESAEEVAAVLAHEMGHVAARDPTREALRSAGSVGVLGLLLGDFAGGGLTLVIVNQMINADYSQEAEAAADAYALARLKANGVSPRALATFFRRLQDEAGEGAATGILAHLASHPELGDRIKAAEDAAGDMVTTPVLTEAEWHDLRWICGL